MRVRVGKVGPHGQLTLMEMDIETLIVLDLHKNGTVVLPPYEITVTLSNGASETRIVNPEPGELSGFETDEELNELADNLMSELALGEDAEVRRIIFDAFEKIRDFKKQK